MQRYQMIGEEVSPGDEGFEGLVARCYSQRQKVRCLCRRDADLDLYIAKRNDVYVIARWPGTGTRHSPHCEHYEAPDFLTGLGQVRGSAIVDDAESGETTLKFGFPLSRGPARAAPQALTNDKPDVKSTGQRLTMRGLLHYLWDRAELTHWHPRMAGKRNWFVVRRQLQIAAMACKARGDSLAKRLYIPETFRLDDKDALLRRRHDHLGPAEASRDAVMILIGEVKAIEPARYGEKIVVRHLPDWPFLMDHDMARRFHKRFAVEEELWRAEADESHLVIAASFSIGPSGLPQLFEITVMPVTREWLPYEALDERTLVRKAVDERRRFVKGLRFNLGSDKPIASITLTDTGPEATATYLVRSMTDAAYDEALMALMRKQGIRHEAWRIGDPLVPPMALLPSPRNLSGGAGRQRVDGEASA